jgi:SMODS-associating 2TM, beta-strand rich effector domain
MELDRLSEHLSVTSDVQALNRDRAVTILTLLSVVIFFLALHFEGGRPLTPLGAWHSIDSTVVIVGILVVCFVHYAWRWPLFHGWLVNVPLLAGNWEASLRPTCPIDEIKNTGDGPLSGTATISQSLFSIGITLATQRSVSHSFAASFDWNEDTRRCRLIYTYGAEPRLRDRLANPRHDGTAVLEIETSSELTGKYFTDRGSQGELRLQRLAREIVALPTA